MMMLTFILFFPIQGGDYRTQLQLGNGALFGASYIQVRIYSGLTLMFLLLIGSYRNFIRGS